MAGEESDPTDRSSYVTLVERVVSEADVLTAYDALEEFCLRELSLNGALEHEVIDRARSRFGGEVVDELVACFVESRWTSDLIARRAEIQSADHRTFLALLLNLPERKLLHRMIDLMTLGATGDALVRELARTLDFDASDVKLTTDLEALEAFVRTSALRPLVGR